MAITVWSFNVAMEHHHFSWVNHHKSSKNGAFSIAMLNLLVLSRERGNDPQ
jgi:hypothetical protein